MYMMVNTGHLDLYHARQLSAKPCMEWHKASVTETTAAHHMLYAVAQTFMQSARHMLQAHCSIWQ
jgi:hypothetical protein